MKSLKSFCNPSNISMFAATVAAALSVGAASAARPPSVDGTTWALQTDLGVVPLFITSQGGAGAPGAATCRNIYGEMGEVNNISGWYCPSTGRIHFVHRNLESHNAVRVFFGNVAGDALGQPVSMVGGMTVLISALGDLGEYDFSATQ
jgi:hypothetical protein